MLRRELGGPECFHGEDEGGAGECVVVESCSGEDPGGGVNTWQFLRRKEEWSWKNEHVSSLLTRERVFCPSMFASITFLYDTAPQSQMAEIIAKTVLAENTWGHLLRNGVAAAWHMRKHTLARSGRR